MKKLSIIIIFLIFNNLTYVKAIEKKYEYKSFSKIGDVKKLVNVEKEIFDDYLGMESLIKLKKKTNKKFEVAVSKGATNYEFEYGVDKYKEAIEKVKMIEETNSEEEAVIINEKGNIIYATNGIGRIVNLYGDNYEYTRNHVIKVYPTETSNEHSTYINSGYIDDVPIIEFKEKRVKILVNGIVGWINIEENGYTNIITVPLNKAKNLSYYIKNNEGDLIHYISSDIQTLEKGHKIVIGKAPGWMEINKKYYSYDCNYFYLDIETLLNDIKENKRENSENKTEKYYNYYSYLPLRTKTKYNEKEINNYLAKNTPEKSILRNTGIDAIEMQEKYGVNAGVMIGIAMNESAKGTSQIALNKNNIFGLNAIDIDTGQADKFNSVKDCMNDFSKNWMSKKYLNPLNWVYNGGCLGNKAFGINMQYASDPYWAEKAVKYYYELDKYLGFKDLFNYKVAIYEKENEVKDANGKIIYKVLKKKNKSAQIGYTTVINNMKDKSYEIYSDMQSDSNDGIYSWNKKTYVNKDGVNIIDRGRWYIENGYYHYMKENEKDAIYWELIEDEWYYFDEEGRMSTGWNFINGYWYFLENSGAMYTGWKYENGIWYYLDENGIMAKGWLLEKGNWYYLSESGEMQKEWRFINKEWYKFNEQGQMITGWHKENEKWYYMNHSGAMARQWDYIDEKWYYFDYSGEMKVGWQYIDEKWYYLYENGAMATNTIVDGWYLDYSGVGIKV